LAGEKSNRETQKQLTGNRAYITETPQANSKKINQEK